MKKTKDIQLNETDLKLILGKDYKTFQTKIITNCFCVTCTEKGRKANAIIVNYKIVLNDLNDISLLGFCKFCGSRVNRYLETGENRMYLKQIKAIRNRKI